MSKYLAFFVLAVVVACVAGCSGAGSDGDPTVIPFPPPDGQAPTGNFDGKGLPMGKITNYPVKLSGQGVAPTIEQEEATTADKGGREGIITPRWRANLTFINVDEQQVWQLRLPMGKWSWRTEDPRVLSLRQSANGRVAYATGLHRGWCKVTATSTRSQRYETYVQVFGRNDYVGVQMPEYRGGYDSYVAGTQEWHVAMGIQSPPDIEGSNDFIPSSWLTSDVRVQTVPRGIVKFESSDITGWSWTATALQDGECDAIFRLYDRVYICHITAKHVDPAKLHIALNSGAVGQTNPDGSITYYCPPMDQLLIDASWDYMGAAGVPAVEPVLNTSVGLSATWTQSHQLILVPQRNGEHLCDFNIAGKVQLIRVVSS